MANISDKNDDTEIPLINFTSKVEKSTIFKLNWRIIPTLITINFLTFVIREAHIFVASDLCESLHLTYSEYGIGTSLFTVAYTIFMGPGLFPFTYSYLNYYY